MIRRGHIFALALVAIFGGACFTTEPVGALQPTQELPPRVRIYRYNGDIIELDRSRIESDTIRGFRFGATAETRVPLSHVDSMTYRRLHRRDTFVLTAFLAFLAFREIKAGLSNFE